MTTPSILPPSSSSSSPTQSILTNSSQWNSCDNLSSQSLSWSSSIDLFVSRCEEGTMDSSSLSLSSLSFSVFSTSSLSHKVVNLLLLPSSNSNKHAIDLPFPFAYLMRTLKLLREGTKSFSFYIHSPITPSQPFFPPLLSPFLLYCRTPSPSLSEVLATF